jgi:curved DNA-binding protein CbpA
MQLAFLFTQLHPDKNLDDPDAGAKFARLGEAWNVLKDEARRGEYDAQIRARVERKRKLGQQDDERKRMRAKLEEGERRATDRTNAQQAARHSDEEARLKLAAEVKNLQKMFYRPPPSRQSAAASADEFYAAAAADLARTASAAAAASAAPEDEGGADAVDASLTLSVRWDSSQGADAVAPPTEAQLRSAFEAYGVVDSIAVSAKRALVSFADAGGLENCLAFSGAQHGFRLARLGAAVAKSAAASSTATAKTHASPPRATARPASPPVAAVTSAAPQQSQSMSHLSYEQQTLARMKALAEKRKADKLKSEAAAAESISSAPP